MAATSSLLFNSTIAHRPWPGGNYKNKEQNCKAETTFLLFPNNQLKQIVCKINEYSYLIEVDVNITILQLH